MLNHSHKTATVVTLSEMFLFFLLDYLKSQPASVVPLERTETWGKWITKGTFAIQIITEMGFVAQSHSMIPANNSSDLCCGAAVVSVLFLSPVKHVPLPFAMKQSLFKHSSWLLPLLSCYQANSSFMSVFPLSLQVHSSLISAAWMNYTWCKIDYYTRTCFK